MTSEAQRLLREIVDGVPHLSAQSWTPVIQGTSSAGVGTYSLQTGVYNAFGNIVVATANLAWSAHTGTGDVQVSGFPFASAGASFPTIVLVDGLTVTGQVFLQLTGSTGTVYAVDSGAASALALDTAVTAFNFTLIYFK